MVGTATTGKQAVHFPEKLKPDVVLLDVCGYRKSMAWRPLDRIHQRLPQTKVIILTNYDNPTYMARCPAALGASADFLLKSVSRDELLAAIRAAASGQTTATEGPFREIRELAQYPSRRG